MGIISPRLRLAVAASVAIAALILHPGAAAVAATDNPSPTATPESSSTPGAPTVASDRATAVDTTGPTFISGTVDKTTLSPSTGNATFTVTVKASDPSGVSTPTISANSTTTDQSEGFGSMDLVAGTATNGTWKRTITLPATAAPGNWEITLFPLKDALGNSSGGFRTIATLTVTTKTLTDTTGPTFISGTVDKTTLSPSTGNATFTVTVKASDPSGVSTPTISANSTTTDQSEGFGSMDLVAGTATNGTWKRTITLPATAAPGNWEITLFPLKDALGNSSGGFRTITTLTVTTKTPTVSPGSVAISGTARVGTSLSATTANWSVGTTFTYVWLADGAAVRGATKKSFTPSAAELGKNLSVKVTGSLPGYKPASKTASATAAVAPGTLVAAIPTIVGTAKVGRSLSVDAGSWSQGATFTYQWFAGSSPIKGATKSTFVPTAAQLGQRLSVKITGTLDGYATTAKTSAQTSPVLK